MQRRHLGRERPSSQRVTRRYSQVRLVTKSCELSETKYCYFYLGAKGHIEDAERYGGIGQSLEQKDF